MSKPLYVFDMDETLINGDCSMIWNAFLVQKGIVNQSNFLSEDRRLMDLYIQGKMNMQEYLDFAMAPLLKLSTDEVDKLVEECVKSEILGQQFTQAKSLIESLSKENIDMLMISASVTFLVAAVGKQIGITHALGIDLQIENNCYTSCIQGVPSYREGKVTRLEQWLASRADQYTDIHFYTDSINDLPLCEFADHAYLVNPCPQLAEQGERYNWSKLSWD
ncbi:HAD-IB family hydrolase [Vibrio sp. OCN044]|uniref:HAD-IB family hydrolase n=1 Tax=Vibrio tetraodonis subsp. pristinus TaxID=2695891 RepID=A0A6L8LXI7_9VIBR|nr:HAD family hydrolase [Vibrio tetraodonis]MYM60203.1 HAD-IB family hydrolase [Vibrio tetraodonis subsp. pristinus]